MPIKEQDLLVFPKLELPWPIPQKPALEPFGEVPFDLGGDRLGGLLHTGEQGGDAFQAFPAAGGDLLLLLARHEAPHDCGGKAMVGISMP